MHPQEKGRENMQNKMMKKYFPVFVLPTLLAFTIGFIVPFIMGVYLSFCNGCKIRGITELCEDFY